MVIRNVLLATEAGLGNGETPIFPIHIFKVKEGVNYNPGEPNYDLFKLACKVSRQTAVPELLLHRRALQPAILQARRSRTPKCAYMGCRTRVHGQCLRSHPRDRLRAGATSPLPRVNLPRIAIRSHGDVDFFFEDLDRKIDLVIAPAARTL